MLDNYFKFNWNYKPIAIFFKCKYLKLLFLDKNKRITNNFLEPYSNLCFEFTHIFITVLFGHILLPSQPNLTCDVTCPTLVKNSSEVFLNKCVCVCRIYIRFLFKKYFYLQLSQKYLFTKKNQVSDWVLSTHSKKWNVFVVIFYVVY